MAAADIIRLLQSGELIMEGLLPWSSNYTFLVQICDNDGLLPQIEAVYKPQHGGTAVVGFSPRNLMSTRTGRLHRQ